MNIFSNEGGIKMALTLLVISIVIMCCIFFNKISDRFGLPMLLVFIMIGMMFGSDGIFKIPFDNYSFAEQVCSVALIFIIFYGGFGTKWSEAKQVAGKSLVMSSGGVIITALLTGLFCHYVLHFEFLEGMLVGAVLSSTDAASVFSVLRSKQLSLKYNTASILELESGSNDPWAYMLTLIILSMIRSSRMINTYSYMLFAQVVYGVVLGAIISQFAVYVLRKIHFEISGFDTIFVSAIAILSYALPSIVGGNGYLSAYIVGIVVGNAGLMNTKTLAHFFDGVTGLCQILIFFLLGLLATPSQIPNIMGLAIAIFIFLTFIARPIATFLIMSPFKAPRNQQGVIIWSGFRGATSIVFAIMATVENAITHSDLFHVVFCIVLISIGLQGTLLPYVARKLDMIDDNGNVLKTFNDYSDEKEVQFIRVVIEENGRWANKQIQELQLSKGMLIVMLLRGKECVRPVGTTKLLPNDILVLCGEGFSDDQMFKLEEIRLTKRHEWCSKEISELPLSDKNFIVIVRRKGKMMIPTGNMKLIEDDVIIMSNL